MRTGRNMDLLPRYDVIQSPEEYIGYLWEGQYNKAALNGSTTPADDANANLFWPSRESVRPITCGTPQIFLSSLIHKHELFVLVLHAVMTLKTGPTMRSKMLQVKKSILNMSGGSDTTTYYTSIGYIEDVGYSINSDFKRYSARLNVSSRPKEWLQTNARLGYSYQVTNNGGQSSDSGSVFWVTTNVPFIYPLFMRDSDGNLVEDPYYGG